MIQSKSDNIPVKVKSELRSKRRRSVKGSLSCFICPQQVPPRARPPRSDKEYLYSSVEGVSEKETFPEQSCWPKILTAWAYPVYFGACGTLNVQYKSIKVLQIFWLPTKKRLSGSGFLFFPSRISREMALYPEATQWSNFYFRLPLPSPSL